MRNEATISEHGHYLLGTHTSDVHYAEWKDHGFSRGMMKTVAN